MIEILQPLKVTDGHTSSVTQNIRQEMDASVDKDLLAFKGSGSIGSLNNKLSLEFMGIVDVDRFFKGSRDKEIAFFIHG